MNSYLAQLLPPLAAAMTMIAKPTKGMKIVDPFCGSGTILIESALQNTFSQHVGFDIEKNAIDIAKENSKLAAVNIEICNEDFYNSYKNIGDYFIVSNPPWGEKHNIEPKHENLFYEKLIAIISQSKGAVILIPEDFN